MYGLTMMKDYLNEILDGSKTFDARSYPTNKRGTITLVDSRSMKVCGTVELVGCREISEEEYSSWHCTGRFKVLIFTPKDKNGKYYAWDFKTPKKLIKPIKLECEKHTWVQLPENIELYYQESLF